MIKRVFHISCRGEECYRIAEFIKENIGVPEISITFRENGLYIELYGYKSDIRNAWARIKQLIRMYRQAHVPTAVGHRVSIEYIVSNIKKTFPPQLLVEVLKRKGYEARYDGEAIETSASLDTLIGLADSIADIISSLKYRVRGSTAKHLIAASTLLTGKPLEKVIDELVEKGYLYYDEDDKIRIKHEWRSALDSYVNE